MSTRFDAIVIGAGQAGPSLTGRLAATGRKVAMIERKLFGGTCVNTGCTPTKTMVASAYAARQAQRAAFYGVTIGGPVAVDMKAVKARQETVSGNSRASLEKRLRDMKNCAVYNGHARFESPHEVRVGAELLAAGEIFLNVGGRARIPNLPGIGQVKYLTNASLLQLEVLPRHLVIVGGGYVGLEFGQMFRRFGSQVTIVEKEVRLLPHEDEDISTSIRQILDNEGIQLRLGAECIHFEPRGDDVAVGLRCDSGEPDVTGSHLLLAMGRQPNTDDLGLERAGVERDPNGYIVVDDQLRTSTPGIWAMGDCNGKGAFTHTAYNDFEIVAANLLDNDPRRVSDRLLTYALYIDPPLGRCGFTEEQVRKSGKPALLATRPMTRVSRALEKGESEGLMKVMVDAATRQILGAAILGTGGDEAIHCILDTMYARAPYTTLQRAVHIHPTVSELIPTMLGDLKPLS
ncbi:MAG TPA: FAD-containing oxidoreductase [Candidatus Binataceae bacterium]|nr:FAD-containing oxidoreductase [Candidatus Binataceae bacterium]